MAAMQMKQSRDVEFYDRTRALCGELHAMRHELKNHIAVMEIMLRDGEYEKLGAYFSQVRGQNTAALEEFHCENPLISSVVNNAASTARAAGVHLDAVAAVPEALSIGDADLCSMLSNLLDNSIEGCLAAGGDQIKASLHTEKGYLFITVTNPAPPDLMIRNPQLTTTKRDPAAHGYGIPIIRRLAEKYNGCVTFQVDNGFFVADVMLCLEGSDT
jgi:sensor histidine kinase regulating citrate/malate metabolism